MRLAWVRFEPLHLSPWQNRCALTNWAMLQPWLWKEFSKIYSTLPDTIVFLVGVWKKNSSILFWYKCFTFWIQLQVSKIIFGSNFQRLKKWNIQLKNWMNLGLDLSYKNRVKIQEKNWMTFGNRIQNLTLGSAYFSLTWFSWTY